MELPVAFERVRFEGFRDAKPRDLKESIAHGYIIERQPTEGIRGIITDKIPLDDNAVSKRVLG